MALKSTTNSAAEPMIWILTISACLISLGLNVYLIRVNGKLYRCNMEQREFIRRRNEVVDQLDREINDLRPKRDAHGRFTR